MATITSQIYFRFPALWRLTFKKVNNYLRAKFRPDLSIHVRDNVDFRVPKTHVRHIEILLSASILTFLPSSAWDSSQANKILHILDDQRRRYGIISIFQDCVHTVANLLTFRSTVTSQVSEGAKLFAYHMSIRHLTPWLRYYYFRFLKINGRCTQILLSISIPTLHCRRHVILH